MIHDFVSHMLTNKSPMNNVSWYANEIIVIIQNEDDNLQMRLCTICTIL